MADLAQRYQVHPSHIDAWTMQLQAQAARVFTPGAGGDGKAAREREIERLRARIGELPVERDFLARRTGK